jgi:hypothetical protein
MRASLEELKTQDEKPLLVLVDCKDFKAPGKRFHIPEDPFGIPFANFGFTFP